MELAFDSERLRSICEDQSLATQEVGSEVAEALKRRLADLRAANSITDLLAGHPRVIAEHLVIDLGMGYSLTLQANHPRNPVNAEGGLNWTIVSRLKVLRIDRNDD